MRGWVELDVNENEPVDLFPDFCLVFALIYTLQDEYKTCRIQSH